MRGPSLFLSASLAGACAPAPAPVEPTPAVTATIEPSTAPAAPLEPQPTEPTMRLLILKSLVRMADCGHDEAVDGLRCAFRAAGAAQAVPDADTLHLFLTDPPGLLLAASEWHPARVLGEAEADAEAVAADCRFDEMGRLSDVRFGAAPGVSGYLYGGTLRVGRATECGFASHRPPVRLSASHLLVMHDDSRRKPPALKRTRDEALAVARRAEQELQGGAAFGEVVVRYSDEPGAAERRGDLGLFTPRAMVPEFTLVLLGTPVGEQSTVFESMFGFHLLRRQPASGP